jgi:protein-tyrosine phosphatase
MKRVLFVCLGNICRSPAAEAVMAKLARDEGQPVEVDSAGTGGWHEGHPSDPRMQKAAAARGYDLSVIRARKIDHGDGYAFDHIIAMDASKLADIEEMRLPDWTAKVRMFGEKDVPDPYHGGADGFAAVLDQLEAGCRKLLGEINDDR